MENDLRKVGPTVAKVIKSETKPTFQYPDNLKKFSSHQEF